MNASPQVTSAPNAFPVLLKGNLGHLSDSTASSECYGSTVAVLRQRAPKLWGRFSRVPFPFSLNLGGSPWQVLPPLGSPPPPLTAVLQLNIKSSRERWPWFAFGVHAYAAWPALNGRRKSPKFKVTQDISHRTPISSGQSAHHIPGDGLRPPPPAIPDQSSFESSRRTRGRS